MSEWFGGLVLHICTNENQCLPFFYQSLLLRIIRGLLQQSRDALIMPHTGNHKMGGINMGRACGD